MAVLCEMPTILYSAQSGPLFVLKLFTSCILRCLVSRSCDRVMSALSVVLLIFSFQFRSAYSYIDQLGHTVPYLIYSISDTGRCQKFG